MPMLKDVWKYKKAARTSDASDLVNDWSASFVKGRSVEPTIVTVRRTPPDLGRDNDFARQCLRRHLLFQEKKTLGNASKSQS
jgi:hypothetical protein